MTAPGERPRVHVAGALPDERVAAVVEHVSTHAPEAWARLAQVETPSPARRPPACPAFGACGGCVLQHLDYERAARLEAGACRARAGGAGRDRRALCRVAAAARLPQSIEAGAGARPDGRLVLGAYAPRSHDVVDTAGCRVAEAPLDDTATALAALLDQAGVVPYDERTLTGDLRHVVLRASHDGRVLATWVATRPLADGPALARAFRAARPEVIGVVEHVNRGRGNAIFAAETDKDRTLDGAATIEDRVDVERRGACACACRAAPSSRPTGASPALAYAAIVRRAVAAPGRARRRRLLRRGRHRARARARRRHRRARHRGPRGRRGRRRRLGGADRRDRRALRRRATSPRGSPPSTAPTWSWSTRRARAARRRSWPRSSASRRARSPTCPAIPTRSGAISPGSPRTATAPSDVTPYDMLPHTPHVEALAIS